MTKIVSCVDLRCVDWSLGLNVMFFFSSRRRHTRCLSDWSSDVCSSDLDCAIQPGVAILAPQYRRHAVGIVARIVDVGHERIRGHRDVHAGFDHCPVALHASIPKPGEGKKLLIRECDQVRDLAPMLIDMPFVEATRELQAALAAAPGPPV